jgi:3-oxoadipate enol-lactonase
MPIARLSAADLYHELEDPGGGARRVLVIGGTGSDLRAEPRPFGWPGAERFAVLSYDHRDLGRSRGHGDGQPRMADFAADALELADHLGWPTFSVLGISFGGMVAQELALLAPERIERLVLAVTSGGGTLGSSYPLHELNARPARERAAVMVELLDSRSASDPDLAAALLAYVSAAAPPDAGLLRQLEARRHHDVSARIGAIQAPCLVVAGRYDRLAPPERSEALAAAIPGAQLEILDGGHGVLLQDPAAWPLIAAFLAGEG